VTPEYVSTGAPARPPSRGRNLGLLAALGLFVVTKGKWLLGLAKVLPAGKLLLTTGSMLAMIAFESVRSGIWFAVGFVLLILVHELGHGVAMKRCGVQAGWPIFIPFFGAMIAMKGLPQDRDKEAEIAYGGPLAGTGAALAVAGLGLALDSRLLLALANVGFFLNLFNLTPISPLDGGRVAQAFSKRAWIVGAAMLVGLFFLTQSLPLLLIALLALPQLLRGASADQRPTLEPAQQRSWALRYFGLAAFLGLAIYFTAGLLHKS
jgi:Zn-dependent protease